MTIEELKAVIVKAAETVAIANERIRLADERIERARSLIRDTQRWIEGK